MKTLSIIVLTYNQQDFIRENLDGIFMQKVNFPVELIICDDHSPDRTDEVIKECLKNTPEHITVKYFRHENNMGSTPNFYFALQKVTGDYLALCEGDDYWTDPQKLQIQYNFLNSNPEYSLCFHTAMNVSPDKTVDGTLFAKVDDRDYSTEEIYRHWVVHTATVMMRSTVLNSPAKLATMQDDTLQYFDTILYMAASTVGKLRGMSRCMSAYRRHDAGLSAGKSNPRRDLKHNHLDEIIGKYYGGAIKKFSDWQIFLRSQPGFSESVKKGDYRNALKFVPWLLRNRILVYWLLKKK